MVRYGVMKQDVMPDRTGMTGKTSLAVKAMRFALLA